MQCQRRSLVFQQQALVVRDQLLEYIARRIELLCIDDGVRNLALRITHLHTMQAGGQEHMRREQLVELGD